MGRFGSGYGLLESICECGIEPPGSISHGVRVNDQEIIGGLRMVRERSLEGGINEKWTLHIGNCKVHCNSVWYIFLPPSSCVMVYQTTMR